MPIKIPDTLPARSTLESENIFVMSNTVALKQDIRPLRIAILNIMPTKIITETQLLRLLSNSPLQVEIKLLQTATYVSKNTSAEHLEEFYVSYKDVMHEKFDGLIITGAPVENLAFEEVLYWNELCEIMEWSRTNVFSTMHICWGAQAGLYYHFGIDKKPLEKKMFGVFRHRALMPSHPLLRGFDEHFNAPHSRHTEIDRIALDANARLSVLAESDIAGAHIIAADDNRRFFITGHCEYDHNTLATEYFRDIDRGLEIDVPYNYFPGDDPAKTPLNTWRAQAHLLFSNWMNYFLYQSTPFDMSMIN